MSTVENNLIFNINNFSVDFNDFFNNTFLLFAFDQKNCIPIATNLSEPF